MHRRLPGLAVLLTLVAPWLVAEELPGLQERQRGTVVDSIVSGMLTWPEEPEAHLGGDLRLPPWVPRQNPFGGLYHLWGRSTDPRLAAVVDVLSLPEMTWADLEPSPGQYVFDRLENGTSDRVGLRALRASGRRGILWFMPWRSGDVPAWAVQRYDLQPVRAHEVDGPFGVMPVWRSGVREDLLRALRRPGGPPAGGSCLRGRVPADLGECFG